MRPELDGAEAALACQRAEQRATGVQVGVMDQFASALGRRGHALLLDCSTLEYQTVPFPDELVIAVIDSGEHRSLADTPYNERRREAGGRTPETSAPRRFRDRSGPRVRRCAPRAAFLNALACCSRSRIRAFGTISRFRRQTSTRWSRGRGGTEGCLGGANHGRGFRRHHRSAGRAWPRNGIRRGDEA